MTGTYDLTMDWGTFDVAEERNRAGYSDEKVSISEALVMSLRKNMKVDIHRSEGATK